MAIVVVYNKRYDKSIYYRFDVQNILPLRGILALLIIFHHLVQRTESVEHIPVFSQFTVWGMYVVSTFFFITGYGLTVSYMKKGAPTLEGFLKRRYVKILPPYLACVATYVIGLSIGSRVMSRSYNPIHEILSHLPDFTGVLLPTSWFIIAILLFYAAFYVVMRLCKTLKSGIIFLLLWSAGYFVILYKLGFGNWWYYSIFALNVGMFYAYFEKKNINIFIQHRLLYLLITLFIFIALYGGIPYVTNHYITLPDLMAKLLHAGNSLLCISLIPIFAVIPGYIVGYSKNNVLSFIGKISLEVYLVQGALCTVFGILGLNQYNPYLYIITVVIFSILCAYTLHSFFAFYHSKQ